jgi:hypothetical protein
MFLVNYGETKSSIAENPDKYQELFPDSPACSPYN